MRWLMESKKGEQYNVSLLAHQEAHIAYDLSSGIDPSLSFRFDMRADALIDCGPPVLLLLHMLRGRACSLLNFTHGEYLYVALAVSYHGSRPACDEARPRPWSVA
jgi:hypothetical protein